MIFFAYMLPFCKRMSICFANSVENHLNHLMTKPTIWLCAQRRLRSAWASSQSDQSLRCPHEEWLRQFWMNIVPWNCQFCPSIVVEFYMSDLVGMSPGSFRVVLFVKFIIDLTTSNENYGQGHLPLFDPGLLYQASHKNIELCKINIFYLHKISVFKKYVWQSLVKIHPVWKHILKLHIQFMI